MTAGKNLLFTNIAIALRAIRINKLRAGLTALGIIIGVASVITMLAVGAGAQAKVEAQIRSLGSNVIVVQPGSVNSGRARMGSGNAQTLSIHDAAAIASQVPTVDKAAASVRGNAQVISGNRNWYTRVTGVTPDYFSVRNFEVVRGRALTAADEASSAKVAVLGKTVIEALFDPGTDPVGQQIRLNLAPFTIVGTLVPKGQSPTGQDQDDEILIPLNTAQKKVLGRTGAKSSTVSNIHVSARSEEFTPLAAAQISDLLRERHRLPAEREDDFQVRMLASRYEAAQESAEAMSFLLAAIAAISLVVGGVGITNIMLVSVKERTKEIGLRQAVGAKSRHILSQFLAEAITLSLMGGILGVALGVGASMGISHAADWPISIQPGGILLALVFSALVGIFFGGYPARRASLLDPIDAIRYE